MVLYSKFTYGSQFSEEENGLEIRFLVPEILSKYKRSIFFETPCIEFSLLATHLKNPGTAVDTGGDNISLLSTSPLCLTYTFKIGTDAN